MISEGGEAIVFCQKFGENEFAVRVQVFDPFLFTKKFAANLIKWKTNLISGKTYNFSLVKIVKISKRRPIIQLMMILLYRFTTMLFEIMRI